jgi:hypothetical protein
LSKHPDAVAKAYETLITDSPLSDRDKKRLKAAVERRGGAIMAVTDGLIAVEQEASRKLLWLKFPQFAGDEMAPRSLHRGGDFGCGILIGVAIGLAVGQVWPLAFAFSAAAGAACAEG